MHRFISVLLYLWLGAFLAIGALAAPAIFDAADTSSQAGLIAGTVFERLNFAGIFFAVTILCLQRPVFGLENALIGFVLFLIFLSQFGVTPKIEMLRELSGGVLSSGTVEYQDFWKWHGISNLIFLSEAIIITTIICLKSKANQN